METAKDTRQKHPHRFPLGLAYDDVLLVPRYSSVDSRKDIDISSFLTRNIKLNTPLVSANMDTVTESAMSIAMAREGGIGIIHRFLPIEHQVEEVLKVKRSEAIIIEKPYTILDTGKLGDAKEIMKSKGINGLPVIDAHKRVVGIVTKRDIQFEDDPNIPIKEIMTKNPITARFGTPTDVAHDILRQHKIEKLPLVNENGVLSGLITNKDIIKKGQFPKSSKDRKGRLLVGAAIGVKGDYLDRAKALIEAETDTIVIDIAHGHHDLVMRACKQLRKDFGNIDIIAGNVATGEAVHDLSRHDVDGIKAGIGGGSICITRIVTGSGVPQLSAILDCSRAARDVGIPIIADQGIRYSGDITKALSAGASTVMMGRMMAGTTESPGRIIIRNGKRHKIFRGMAGFGANLSKKERMSEDIGMHGYVPEGVESTVEYKGDASEVIGQLVGGLRSGMSYCGAHNIQQLWQNARFIRITHSALKESHAHDVDVI